MLNYAVALTGGIATGKSSAVAILSLFGFRTIDADKIAHTIIDSKKDEIASLFGKEFIKDGRVDRKALGRFIFSDKEAKNSLETLLHPPIREEILYRAEKEEKFSKPYLIDLPLFFETRAYNIKRVIVVYAPKELQLKRIIKRDGLSEAEAKRRVESQIDIETKRSLATWVIDNSKNLKQLQYECERVKEEIVNLSFENHLC